MTDEEGKIAALIRRSVRQAFDAGVACAKKPSSGTGARAAVEDTVVALLEGYLELEVERRAALLREASP